MSQMQIQGFIFQYIREKLTSEASLADCIADLLHISNDSAYRRIRSETPLVLEEVKVLCNAFSISLDQLLKTTNSSVLFTPFFLDNHTYNFKQYLQDILANLKAVAAANKKEIFYLSKDVVFFHNFLFKPLFAFRYFFWMKSILQHTHFISQQFSFDMLTNDIECIGREIIKLYNAVPSTEIWNTESINSTISQIEYYREAGFFKSANDAEVVYESLRNMVEHLRAQAEAGSKFLPDEKTQSKKINFQFFQNRLVLGDNTILVIADNTKTLYLNYDVLNYMKTQDEQFCTNVYKNLQGFIRHSTILSGVSEKQRNIFFNVLLKKIPNRTKAVLK